MDTVKKYVLFDAIDIIDTVGRKFDELAKQAQEFKELCTKVLKMIHLSKAGWHLCGKPHPFYFENLKKYVNQKSQINLPHLF